jgi:hypothetical protein
MQDATQENRVVSHSDVIEQNQMLVNLSHLAHGNDPQAEPSRQQFTLRAIGMTRVQIFQPVNRDRERIST